MTTEDPGVSAPARRVSRLSAELRAAAANSVCRVSMCSSSLLLRAADEVERLRTGARFDAETVAALAAELAEWRKLRDPGSLHANLLRGFPAQLDRETYLHLAGDDQVMQAPSECAAAGGAKDWTRW